MNDSLKDGPVKKTVISREDILKSGLYFLTMIVIVCAAATIYITNINAVSFDEELYIIKFDEFDIWSRFESTEDLRSEVRLLQEYLRYGDREQEIMSSDFYNDREKTHLKEVRDLYDSIHFLGILTLVAGLVSTAGMITLFKYVSEGKAGAEVRDEALDHIAILLMGIGFICVGLAIMFALMGVFFSVTFHYFHVLLFPTDTWMLNPATDNLIRMFPQKFFFDMFVRIVLLSVIEGAVLLGIGEVVHHRRRLKAVFIRK